ncbi:MAG: SpoIIE family protein phosphatase [Leptospiraceae bacterium]|nr:SpoIIE family protein phosphatase [Leptospiraceae bacterium]
MLKFFLLIQFLLIPIFASENEVLVFDSIHELKPIGKYLYFLEDTSKNITIEDISKNSTKYNFNKHEKDFFNHVATENPIWLRFDLENKTDSELILELGSTFIWYIDCYKLKSNGNFTKIANLGTMRPESERFYNTNVFWIPIMKEKDFPKQTYYIKISSDYPIEIPLRIGTLKSMIPHKRIQDYIIAGFIGILLITFFYNLFLFIYIRDILYLYYIGYIFWAALMVPFMNHYPFIENLEFGSIDKKWWHEKFIFWHSFGYAFIALFLFKYVDLYKYSKKLFYYICSMIFIYIFGFGLLNLFGVSIIYLSTPFQIFSMLFYSSCFLTSFYVYLRGYTRAIYYFFGWTFLMLGMICFVLTINGFIPDNYFNRSSMMIGVAIEIWMFSLALGDRFNTMRIEKEEVTKKLLLKSQENEKIILEQNELLELQVKNRTSELQSQFEKTEELLISIKKDLNFAKKIQARVLPINLRRLDKFKIVSRYEPMDEVGGDLFDIYKMDNIIRIILADAEGHGVQAALVTMLIKSELETLKETAISPSNLLHELNDLFITKYVNLNAFFTCFVADIDIIRETILFSSAGHPAQYLIHKDSIDELKSTGRILGVSKNANFSEIEMKFEFGDKLFFFTDGLFEEFNQEGEEFGSEQLLELANNNKEQKIEFLVDKTLSTLDSFLRNRPKQDDITIVGIEY